MQHDCNDRRRKSCLLRSWNPGECESFLSRSREQANGSEQSTLSSALEHGDAKQVHACKQVLGPRTQPHKRLGPQTQHWELVMM